ncbi:unnamed protein product [Gemmata massiliana]|uniref:Uncharacterized protein n=1 Tax=Gemmata massiliana TaxID=1210884 RepID=A0A6P2CZ70_9BACT|nr:hypothetical protein [Gemmata massiliana]VTR93425.1 unnamed protein product [Gemmata massiliana]
MSDDNRSRGPATRGPYQVWHRSDEGFTPVALVNGGNLLAAIVFTMSRTDGHWQDGERVTALVPDARSTNIGDVIVSPEGVAHELTATDHGPACVPIDFPPHREQRALFAEWAADYAAARERDGRTTLEALRSVAADRRDQSTNDKQQNREDGIER